MLDIILNKINQHKNQLQDPKISAPMKAQTTVNHSQSMMTMIVLPLEFKLPDTVMSPCIEKLMDIPQEIYTHTSDQVLVFINHFV